MDAQALIEALDTIEQTIVDHMPAPSDARDGAFQALQNLETALRRDPDIDNAIGIDSWSQ